MAWDGREVLDELWEKHGGSGLRREQFPAARRVLGSIMWGELAAWKVAAKLADQLEPLEARLAATSQAHDEARHFYVMHDYLVRTTGDFDRGVSKATEALLRAALTADSPAKMIIGMQLQLETTALTLFHALRESNICPVLTELLVYYEKDEARHVGLGTQLLPTLMREMSIRERLAFSAYSFKVVAWSLASLKKTEDDLRALGLDPRRVAVLGKSKQMMAFEELWMQPGMKKNAINERIGLAFDAIAEALWPDAEADPRLHARAQRVLKTLVDGYETTETFLDPTEVPMDPAPSTPTATSSSS